MTASSEPSKDSFEVFYKEPGRLSLRGTVSRFFISKLSQIEVLDIGDKYNVTLTFEKDLERSVEMKAGTLEISYRYSPGGMGGDYKLSSRITGVSQTQVASLGKILRAQLEKVPTVGTFSSKGILLCPGLVVEIPHTPDVHLAVIDTLAKRYHISVEKNRLGVKGAMLSLEANEDLRFTLSVQETSAAKEFKVELEREGKFLDKQVRTEVLASSMEEGAHVSKVWTPAIPPVRRVIVGHSNPVSGDSIRLVEVLGEKKSGLLGETYIPAVIGDPVPDTKYSIRLVAKKGRFKKDEVDESTITFV